MSQNVKTSSKTTAAAPRGKANTLPVLIAIIALAAVAVVVLIAYSLSNRVGLDTDLVASIPQSRGADGAFILGDPAAPITIVEFADYFCPACQQYKPQINQLIEEDVATGRAKLEFRMLITAGGENMRYAGQMAECSEELKPGSFWVAYENLYEMAITNNFGRNAAQTFADRMGLNAGDLISCTRTSDQIEIDQRYARSLGVSSTPTVLFRIGDGTPQPIPGNRDYPSLKAVIDAAQGL